MKNNESLAPVQVSRANSFYQRIAIDKLTYRSLKALSKKTGKPITRLIADLVKTAKRPAAKLTTISAQ